LPESVPEKIELLRGEMATQLRHGWRSQPVVPKRIRQPRQHAGFLAARLALLPGAREQFRHLLLARSHHPRQPLERADDHATVDDLQGGAAVPAGDCEPRLLEGAHEAEALARRARGAGNKIERLEGSELALDLRGLLQRVGTAQGCRPDRDLARGIAEFADLLARAIDLDHQPRAPTFARGAAPTHDIPAATSAGVTLDGVVAAS